MSRYIGLFLMVALLPCALLFTIDNEDVDEDLRDLLGKDYNGGRHKRQASNDACMQIYTVPKRTVQCDPSDETRDAIEAIRGRMEDHGLTIEGLGIRIDEIDPNKEKELPEEVKARLLSIDEVQESQASHSEAVKRLDEVMGHIRNRMEQIEAQDRLQMANMVEQQGTLIRAALHRANSSLHDEYIARLTTSTQDLSSRIQQLQLDVTEDLRTTENGLRDQMRETDEATRTELMDLTEKLETRTGDLGDEIAAEAEERARYQEQTDGLQVSVEELQDRLTSIREHQAEALGTDNHQTEQIHHLQQLLQQVTTEKDDLSVRSTDLEGTLSLLQDSFRLMKDDLNQCRNDSQNLRVILETLLEKARRREHMLPRTLKIRDCQDVLKYYFSASGIFTISPDPTTRPFDVYCDMATDNEGWTMLQRRQTGDVDFFRGWEAYNEGFGDLEGEFWLGLRPLYHMTHAKRYRLRVELEDWEGRWFHAEYNEFSIAPEAENYALHVGGYHGNAGDSLAYHEGMPFSTMDRNNDANSGICATWCRGAWWYKDCFESNLNGVYHPSGPYVTKTGWGDGMVWKHIKNTNYYSLKSSIMKIIPVDMEL